MVNDVQFTALTLSPDVWRYLPDAIAADGYAPGFSLPATEARGYIIIYTFISFKTCRSLQLIAYSLQLIAYSLQLIAYSLQLTAFKLILRFFFLEK